MASQIEVARSTTPGVKTVLRKASSKNLNTATPQGGRSKKPHGSLGRSTTISHSPPSKANKGHGRGDLTLQIEDNVVIEQSIQSAPVRMCRPLPTVPVPPLPRASSSTLVAPRIALADTSDAQLTPRVIRPLPCPPPLVTVPPRTPPGEASLESPPPTERPRVVRPLPIPSLKVEPLRFSRQIPKQPLPSCNLRVIETPKTPTLPPPPPPPPPPPLPDANKKSHHSSLHEKTQSKKTRLREAERRGDIENERHKRVVLNRNRPRLSHDSNRTSEDDEGDDVFGNLVHAEMKQREEEDSVDYAWVLSNNILYRQKPHETPDSRKWVREKRGRRITEQDYDTILQVLRTL